MLLPMLSKGGGSVCIQDLNVVETLVLQYAGITINVLMSKFVR